MNHLWDTICSDGKHSRRNKKVRSSWHDFEFWIFQIDREWKELKFLGLYITLSSALTVISRILTWSDYPSYQKPKGLPSTVMNKTSSELHEHLVLSSFPCTRSRRTKLVPSLESDTVLSREIYRLYGETMGSRSPYFSYKFTPGTSEHKPRQDVIPLCPRRQNKNL